jgi:hypothetical protein
MPVSGMPWGSDIHPSVAVAVAVAAFYGPNDFAFQSLLLASRIGSAPSVPAEVLASRGIVVVESWQVVSCRSYLCSRGKAVLTLHPPLIPLSHIVNPRDGAQDIAREAAALYLRSRGGNMLIPS